jgi:hypothetical protein
MKTKLYLDTSIPSAYFDYNKPVRQLITQKWFENNAKNFLYLFLLSQLKKSMHIKILQKEKK